MNVKNSPSVTRTSRRQTRRDAAGNSYGAGPNLNRIREALEAKLAELRRRHPALEEVQVDRFADELDLIVSIRNANMAARSITEDYRTRAAVEDALRRIRTGGYGLCEECGRRIHPKRLDAIPWAALCLRCQELEDRKAA